MEEARALFGWAQRRPAHVAPIWCDPACMVRKHLRAARKRRRPMPRSAAPAAALQPLRPMWLSSCKSRCAAACVDGEAVPRVAGLPDACGNWHRDCKNNLVYIKVFSWTS